MSGPFQPREPEREEPPAHRRKSLAPSKPSRVGGTGPNTTWIVGVVAVLFLAYITYNTITTDSGGSIGVPSGQELPPFAAPLALANAKCENDDGDEQDCDANVLRRARDGHPKACDVRGPEVVNSCQLTEEGPAVISFLAEPSAECADQTDILDRLAPRYPDIEFAVIGIRGDHDELNDLIRERGWSIPVAYDNDGAVTNAFFVAVCPTMTFAAQGGEVVHTEVNPTTEDVIVRQLEALRRGS